MTADLDVGETRANYAHSSMAEMALSVRDVLQYLHQRGDPRKDIIRDIVVEIQEHRKARGR